MDRATKICLKGNISLSRVLSCLYRDLSMQAPCDSTLCINPASLQPYYALVYHVDLISNPLRFKSLGYHRATEKKKMRRKPSLWRLISSCSQSSSLASGIRPVYARSGHSEPSNEASAICWLRSVPLRTFAPSLWCCRGTTVG